MVKAMPFSTILQKGKSCNKADITVIITCYNYGAECIEALDSLAGQTESCFELIVVDDRSTDDSVQVVRDWLETHDIENKIIRCQLVRHNENQGLSLSRNTGIALSTTPYVFVLDADNMLYPRALSELKRVIINSGYEMAYSLIEQFGEKQGIMNNYVWNPERFAYGNYIDAMALIRRDILVELGGYRCMPDNFGWEDYDLWCSFVDRGYRGCYVPQILCRYRVRQTSMLNSQTNTYFVKNFSRILRFFQNNHPGIKFKLKC